MKKNCIHEHGFVVGREIVPYLFRAAVEKHPLPNWFINRDVFQMPIDEYIRRAQEDILHPCCYNMEVLQSLITPNVDLTLYQEFYGTASTEDGVACSVMMQESNRYEAKYNCDPILFLPANRKAKLYTRVYSSPMELEEELIYKMRPYLRYIPRNISRLKYICYIEGVVEG